MTRLSATTASLAYDRAKIATGVVHLGLGAFHRAHQAPVFDAILASGDSRWGVAAIAMRSRGVAQVIDEQDGLYSLAERSDAPFAPRVIGSIVQTAVAADDPAAVIALLAAPETHLVTLTITEKGYALSECGVDATAGGMIAAALDQRRRAGLAPLTVISCDNRSGNGEAARATVLAAAGWLKLDAETIDWIERDVAFPSTMVDRITPATTDAMIAETSKALGFEDRAAVWTEPFWQWVIEDRFAGEKPDFAAHGVQIVADVAPWEDAKLRLLNAAHSTLAYAGSLAGHTYVHEAIADPKLRAMVEAVWDEAAVTLDAKVIAIPAYRAALLDRFANPALAHALIQIAADGSQKVPPRLLATMKARLPDESPAVARAVSAWIDTLRSDLPLSDPMLDRLRPLARTGDIAAIFDAIGADPALAAHVQPATLPA